MTLARRKILIAGMGTSPAVLTNVVWALTHGEKPVVPDEIVVFITKNGKTLLKKELFDDGVWADMLKSLAREGIDIDGKLLFGETSIRSIPDVLGNEIDDLRTGDDNLRAADFMLGELRKYTDGRGGTVPIFLFPKHGARFMARISGTTYPGGKVKCDSLTFRSCVCVAGIGSNSERYLRNMRSSHLN